MTSLRGGRAARAARGIALATLSFSFAIGSVARSAVPARLPGESDVVSRTLSNGMQVLVWPDDDIPNVVLYTFVRVGSRNELPGMTGLSHFFEHMMFNGTSTRPPGEFDRVLEAAGGSNNAYTTKDLTVYQDWFPRSALELIFDLESDRLRNLAFDPQVIEKERDIVQSERRSAIDDDNGGALIEQVTATAFIAHTYQNPIIGWPSDIDAWSLDDLKAFFATYYAPNNCTLVFVGDVQPREVFALAERYLAPIPAQPAPRELRVVEPEQLGERRVTLVRPALTPLLMLAYKGPDGRDPRGYALDLLLDVLAGGDYSRLYRLLVDDLRVAVAVSAWRQAGFDPGLTWISVVLPAEGDIARVEQMLVEQLARVSREGVTEEELSRAKNVQTAAYVRGLATIDGKAAALGRAEVVQGDYRILFGAPADYAAVTGEDIRRIAADVFDPRRRTVGVLQPQAADAVPSEAGDAE